MRTTKGAGLLAGVLTLTYGVYVLGIFVSMMAGFWSPASSVLNPWVLAALDMVVYLFLGAQILRDRREFSVLAVFWTILGVAIATFGYSYRNDVLNFLSFLIVFFGTYYHVAGTKTDLAVAKSLGLLAGVFALVQGIYLAFEIIFTFTQASLVPSLTVAAITAGVYTATGVGILRNRKEFFLLAILWTLVESALAVADSSFVRSHFNMISILILAFATYYYFAKTKTR